MTIEQMTTVPFIQMLKDGAEALSTQSEMINALNVFPVPDGDTGTNMSLTIKAGISYLNDQNPSRVDEAASMFARGLLMGARGNSGVILSQIFRGFSKGLAHREFITAADFSKALKMGVDTAFQAVIKPVEGTILTVAKDAAYAAEKKAKRSRDILEVLSAALEEAKASLKRTPNLLPILKEAGVVDSGGQGLVCVYQGFLQSLNGEKINSDQALVPEMESLVNAEHHKFSRTSSHEEDITYGFCTEFMVRLKEPDAFNPLQLKEKLSLSGDSLVVVNDDNLLKVHIHTEAPGEMLTLGQHYGELVKIKVDNMREQNAKLQPKEAATASSVKKETVSSHREFGIVTVAMGNGIKKLFESSGAHEVIEGGQTMNPSTEDLVKAIENTGAKTVYILPNNSNIIMAANQAADISDATVIVIPTRSISQGLAAILSFDSNKSAEGNSKQMTEAYQGIVSGQITQAVRDTLIDEVAIKKEDYLGIVEGKIQLSVAERMDCVKEVLIRMIHEEHEIATVIYGQGVPKKEKQQLEKWAEDAFPSVELEYHEGGQPVYDYLISAE